ncbi:MAG: type II secretion system protein [Kiritimatiellia bacterium]
MRPSSTARNSRGFTLIELLVVVAIIGLLIAVLSPAIMGALRNGKRKTVENNMRQMGMGTAMYAQANGDLLPKPREGSAGKPSWSALNNDALWANAAPAAVDGKTANEYATASSKSSFYSSTSLFYASGARYPSSKLATPEWAFGMNLNLQESDGSQKKINSFSKAASMVLYAEGGMSGEDKPNGYGSQTYAGNMAVEAVNFVTRYNNIGSICFADGHVTGLTAAEVLATTTSVEWVP